MPQKLINALIEKYSMHTTVQKFGDSIVSSNLAVKGNLFTPAELEMAAKMARVIVSSRGITPPKIDTVVEDNLKFINRIDPALGGADGFGVKPTIVHEDIKIEAQPYDNNNDIVEGNSSFVGDTGDSNDNGNKEDKTNGTGGLASVARLQTKGLRKLGGVK